MTPLRIALIGAGTVGGGVLRLLADNRDLIAARAGRKIEVAIVAVRDAAKAKKRLGDSVAVTDDWKSAIARSDISAVAELMGGEDEAKSCAMAAVESGRHLVTANKALLASQGGEIFAAAARKKVAVGFEAAVAGGIPIVKTLKESLAGNRVRAVYGIINGTCNYILSAMRGGGGDFNSALAEAQQLGYAEADPALDIGGDDSAHKIALIAALAFGAPLDLPKINCEGIKGIDPRDIRYPEQFGYRVKLLAAAKRVGDSAEIHVRPTLIPRAHLLASVDGAMNAVVVESDAAGETIYYGAGAGALPTASAAVADLIEIARLGENIPPPPLCANDSPALEIADPGCARAPHYLRLEAIDRPGVLADLARILAARRISIEAIWQPDSRESEPVDLVMLLHSAALADVRESVSEIERLDSVASKISVMAIERPTE